MCSSIRNETNQKRNADIEDWRRISSSSPNEVDYFCDICYLLGGPVKEISWQGLIRQ